VLLAAGCGEAESDRGAEGVPSACAALARAAERASRCDPGLRTAERGLRLQGDEAACIRAVRELLEPSPAGVRRVASIYGQVGAPPRALGPLGGDELRRLGALELPATLVIRPDRPRAPGIPETRVSARGVVGSGDTHGTVVLHLAPGRHEVRVAHAGEEVAYCIDVDACETLELTAHGAHLAPHPRLRAGSC
jgi:hypothetical protein